MIVHPAYDPVGKVWFLEGHPGIAGPTIKDLLAALPARTRIKDYYPNGYTAKRGTNTYGLGTVEKATRMDAFGLHS
jgi:hypothetical protein